jgi:HAD superfamily hydrolase (TIGR01509 family)
MARGNRAPQLGAIRPLLADVDALLLDFNGTLSDDEDLLYELTAAVAEEQLGVTVSREQYFTEFVGYSDERVFRELVGDDELALAQVLVGTMNEKYLTSIRRHPRISEDAAEFVRSARALGKRIAVVTSASRSVVVPALDNSGLLDHVDVVVALEDVVETKPAPEGYLRALDLLGMDPDRSVAFEDTRTGLQAARAAGVRVVAVGDNAAAGDFAALTPFATTALHPDLC